MMKLYCKGIFSYVRHTPHDRFVSAAVAHEDMFGGWSHGQVVSLWGGCPYYDYFACIYPRVLEPPKNELYCLEHKKPEVFRLEKK